jgi:ABC-type glycerol-3-phosphate transport system permease component
MNRFSGLLSPRGQTLMFAALALLVFTAFPFAWMASTAVKPSREIFITPPTLWPAHVTLDNLARLFADTRFLTYFRNSLIVSFATVGLTLLVSVPAAYGLTRFRFYGREMIAGLILFTYMFAPIMIIIPFYVAMRFLGLTNTHCVLPAFQPMAAAHLLSEHPARDRRGGEDRWQPHAGGHPRCLAARIARRGCDWHLHLHSRLERLHLRARAAQCR